MLDEEKRARVALFLKASKTFPRNPLDLESVSQYVTLTADLDLTLLSAALTKIALEARFFPTISEIRAAAFDLYADITGVTIATAEEAWGEVMDNIRHYGMYDSHPWTYTTPIIADAVKQFGGRAAFYSLTEDSTAAARAHFFRIYESCVKRQRQKAQNASVYNLIGTSKGELQTLLTRSSAAHDMNNILQVKELA